MRKIITFIYLSLYSFNSLACSIESGSFLDYIQSAEHVVLGKITSHTPIKSEHMFVDTEITIEILETFKGNNKQGNYIKALTSTYSMMCGTGVDNGEKLFFISADGYTGAPTGTMSRFLAKGIENNSFINILKKLRSNKT